MNIISPQCSTPLASSYLGLICYSWENTVLLSVHRGLTSAACEKTQCTFDQAWIPALSCWEFGSPACLQSGLRLQNLPVLCVCMFVCPTQAYVYACTSTEVFGSIFRVNLSAGSQLLSPVMSWCGLKQTAWASSTAIWSLEGRMRRQVFSVP